MSILNQLNFMASFFKVASDISYVLGHEQTKMHPQNELVIFAQAIIDAIQTFQNHNYVSVNVKDCLLVAGDPWIITALESIGISIEVLIDINDKDPLKVFTRVRLYRKGTIIAIPFIITPLALEILEQIAQTDKEFHDALDANDNANTEQIQMFQDIEPYFNEFMSDEDVIDVMYADNYYPKFDPEDEQYIEFKKCCPDQGLVVL